MCREKPRFGSFGLMPKALQLMANNANGMQRPLLASRRWMRTPRVAERATAARRKSTAEPVRSSARICAKPTRLWSSMATGGSCSP